MIVYAGGTFDLLHPGHVAFFRQARDLGDSLVVGLNTDEFAARYKRKPVMSLGERYAMVSALKMVDGVLVNYGDEDSRPAILNSGAKIVVHGDDWTGDALMEQMGFDQAWLDKHGIHLAYVPYSKNWSTSGIIHRLRPQVIVPPEYVSLGWGDGL